MIRICGKKSWSRKIILGLGVIASCSAATLATDTITGVARNQTLRLVAAGDEVILLRLDQDMQEEARTKTDSQGLFTLKVEHPDKLHLVRVVHQGVNYDQRAASNSVSIDVFDAATKVQGVTGSIEIIRVGTNGKLLHVSDMVEIKNDSSPPLTEAGERTFEVYLPAHAKIDSVLAAGPGKIGAMISAVPVSSEPGHYAVKFPLQPGSTKFAFNYDIPYDGHAAFRPKLAYPVQQLAVMIPPTMRFRSPSSAFRILPTGGGSYRVEAATQVNAGEGPEFEISGIGALPVLQAQSQSQSKVPIAALPTPTLSASGISETRDQGSSALVAVPASGLAVRSTRVQWWPLDVSAVLILGAGGFFLWRRQRLSANAMKSVRRRERPGRTPPSLVEALKEELFQLEVDRLHGAISGEEYESAKQALDGTVMRALARAGPRLGAAQN